jgi:hypothetical protein
MLGKSNHATEKEAREVIQNFPVERLPTLPGSNGRPPSWMDVQNVFCEYSKYARLVERGGVAGKPYTRGEHFDFIINITG